MWRDRFARGLVQDASGCALAVDAPYRVGMEVRYFREVPDEPRIPFEAQIFGTAANNGQMIAEVAANNRINETFRQIAMQVTGRMTPVAAGKSQSLKLPSFLKKKRA